MPKSESLWKRGGDHIFMPLHCESKLPHRRGISDIKPDGAIQYSPYSISNDCA